MAGEGGTAARGSGNFPLAAEAMMLDSRGADHDKEELPEEDYDDIVNGWNVKLKRSSAGEQRWGLFIATNDPPTM